MLPLRGAGRFGPGRVAPLFPHLHSRTGCKSTLALARLPLAAVLGAEGSERNATKRVCRMDTTSQLQRLLDESSDRANPGPEELGEIFESVRSIAVVGISRDPEKAARRVPTYLAAKGYDVIPVNPFVDRILGQEARDSLPEVTEPVDMVLVFRPSEEAAKIAEVALARAEKPVIWLQEGIQADEVAARAREQGVKVVQDLCTYKVHKILNPE